MTAELSGVIGGMANAIQDLKTTVLHITMTFVVYVVKKELSPKPEISDILWMAGIKIK